MTDVERYLNIIGVPRNHPSLTFLEEIVKCHLASVPYENVSKLIRFHEHGATIPAFAEFIAGLSKNTYGGTCFAQNIHLNHILKELGFKSKPMASHRDGLLSHISLSVCIDRSNYLVDVGIMSSVAGPYKLHPDSSFDTLVGNQRYVFLPANDRENYSLEIYRDGKLIRSFQSSTEMITENELVAGIKKTFEPSALFMTTLCAHRAFEKYSIGVWNNRLYRVEGQNRMVRELRNFSELEQAFENELELPNYPLEFALGLLEKSGVAKLF